MSDKELDGRVAIITGAGDKAFCTGGEQASEEAARGDGWVKLVGDWIDRSVGVANTHVVAHAGKILALVESSFPHVLTPELGTVGPYDFDGRLTTAMTAHPKTDPGTGELHFFGYGNIFAPHVSYHRADATGELTINRPLDVPALTMMHDFALTAEHVVFMDLPVVFDLDIALTGESDMPYRWDDNYGARFGVMRRDDPFGPVRWFRPGHTWFNRRMLDQIHRHGYRCAMASAYALEFLPISAPSGTSVSGSSTNRAHSSNPSSTRK